MISLDSHPTIVPRNGGCEPRIICEEVPVDRETTNNIVSFPQCLEVYRCGGCCQEPQFPCVPVHEVPLTFSPVSKTKHVQQFSCEVLFYLVIINFFGRWKPISSE